MTGQRCVVACYVAVGKKEREEGFPPFFPRFKELFFSSGFFANLRAAPNGEKGFRKACIYVPGVLFSDRKLILSSKKERKKKNWTSVRTNCRQTFSFPPKEEEGVCDLNS